MMLRNGSVNAVAHNVCDKLEKIGRKDNTEFISVTQ